MLPRTAGTSEKLILAGERREDFDTLLNDLVEEHSPKPPTRAISSKTPRSPLVSLAQAARLQLCRNRALRRATRAGAVAARRLSQVSPPRPL